MPLSSTMRPGQVAGSIEFSFNTEFEVVQKDVLAGDNVAIQEHVKEFLANGADPRSNPQPRHVARHGGNR